MGVFTKWPKSGGLGHVRGLRLLIWNVFAKRTRFILANRQKDDQYSALSAVEAARRYRRQTSTLSGTAIAAPMQNPNQLIEEHHNGSI